MRLSRREIALVCDLSFQDGYLGRPKSQVICTINSQAEQVTRVDSPALGIPAIGSMSLTEWNGNRVRSNGRVAVDDCFNLTHWER